MEFILNSDWVLINEFDELRNFDSFLKINLPDTFIRSSRDVQCSFNTTINEIHFMKHKTKLNKTRNFMKFSYQYYFLRCEKCNKAKLFRRCVENKPKIINNEYSRSIKFISRFCFLIFVFIFILIFINYQ